MKPLCVCWLLGVGSCSLGERPMGLEKLWVVGWGRESNGKVNGVGGWLAQEKLGKARVIESFPSVRGCGRAEFRVGQRQVAWGSTVVGQWPCTRLPKAWQGFHWPS